MLWAGPDVRVLRGSSEAEGSSEDPVASSKRKLCWDSNVLVDSYSHSFLALLSSAPPVKVLLTAGSTQAQLLALILPSPLSPRRPCPSRRV